MNLVTLEGIKAGWRSNPGILTGGCGRTVRNDTSEPVLHDNSAGWRFDLGKGLKAMFQFGYARVVKERAGESTAPNVSCRDRGAGPSTKTLSRCITAYFDKIYTEA